MEPIAGSEQTQPPWMVMLLGGASGIGKTQVSYRLARHYGVGITEIDDFQVILERITTPEQFPIVHFFRRNPDAWHRMSDDERLAFVIGFAELMADPLEAVIANHIRGGPPIVLEGDFLPPSLVRQPAYNGVPAAGQVRGVFIVETDEQQIARNYLTREGEEQPERAHSSWRYSEWLRQEAERLGIPTVPARPWETVLERAVAAIDRQNG